MLLIVNFNSSLVITSPDTFVKLAGQIAGRLEESPETTFLLSVIQTGFELPQPVGKDIDWQPKVEIIQSGIPNNLGNVLENKEPLYCKALDLAQTQDQLTYFEIGKILLENTGMATPKRETDWNWQDQGPVVFILPQDEAIAAFFGHALIHFLTGANFWSRILILTRRDPITLEEWD